MRSRHSHAGRRAGGFTLVELLVVIVIIAALAAISFGVARSALNKAKLTKSVNNVRDFGNRIQIYAGDHAGLLPVYHSEGDNLYWWGELVEDPKNESQLMIFESPNDKAFNVKKIENTISYGWNAEVMGRTDTPESSSSEDGPKRVASFSDPTRVLVLADGPKGGNKGLLDSTQLPDEKRYNGKAAALTLDGAGHEFDIVGEFRGKTKWFVNPDKTNGN